MALVAINRIQGVGKVLKGKGVGTKTAFAGDIFECKAAAEAKRLIGKGAAEELNRQDPLDGIGDTGDGDEPKIAGKVTYVFFEDSGTGRIVQKGEVVPTDDGATVLKSKAAWEKVCEEHNLDLATGEKIEDDGLGLDE